METRPAALQNVHPSKPTAPIIHCRCCGRFIEPQWQAGSIRRSGCWLITCQTADCTLVGYTFSAGGYKELDLAPYLESARRHH